LARGPNTHLRGRRGRGSLPSKSLNGSPYSQPGFSRAALPCPLFPNKSNGKKGEFSNKGDGVPFTALYPDFEEYFEEVRRLVEEAGEKKWREDFDKGHFEED